MVSEFLVQTSELDYRMVMERMWYGWCLPELDVSLAIVRGMVRYTVSISTVRKAHLPIEPKSVTIGALVCQYIHILVINTDLNEPGSVHRIP
jgi:hypothetical protein